MEWLLSSIFPLSIKSLFRLQIMPLVHVYAFRRICVLCYKLNMIFLSLQIYAIPIFYSVWIINEEKNPYRPRQCLECKYNSSGRWKKHETLNTFCANETGQYNYHTYRWFNSIANIRLNHLQIWLRLRYIIHKTFKKLKKMTITRLYSAVLNCSFLYCNLHSITTWRWN